jgi:N-acetylmuramoyl-L-alanine amidase-like protein
MADPIPAVTLQRILVSEGVKIKAHPGWPTHERDDETGKTFGPVHGVMIHHTASHSSGEYLWSGSAKLPGPLCHGYIDKTGVCELMSAGRANHAGGGDPNVLNAVKAESYMTKPPATQYHEGEAGAADGNDAFYGFECENFGDGKDLWPPVQYEAMVKATAAIIRHYGWTEKSVIGHLEWSDWKSDPAGFTMVQFRGHVKQCLAAKPGEWRLSATNPGTKLSVEQRLDRIEKKLGLT